MTAITINTFNKFLHFALLGPTRINASNIVYDEDVVADNHSDASEQSASYSVNEWISFKMDATDAQLVVKTRQFFYSVYIHYLQNCGSAEKWRRPINFVAQSPTLLDTIEKVLKQEDIALGFKQPEYIGTRPRAVPNKFIVALNAYFSWDKYQEPISSTAVCKLNRALPFLQKICTYICRTPFLERQFFLVYLSESTDMVFRKYTNKWLQESVGEYVGPFINSSKLTYLIMYNKAPDQFCTIAWIKANYGLFMLQECFKNKVPMQELM